MSLIKIRVKNDTIGSLFLTDDSIQLAPLFETNTCAIKYSRGIPGNRAVRKRLEITEAEKQKVAKKEKDSHSETSFFGSLIRFKITENHELCVVVDGDEEMLYPLDYVRAVKILS